MADSATIETKRTAKRRAGSRKAVEQTAEGGTLYLKINPALNEAFEQARMASMDQPQRAEFARRLLVEALEARKGDD